jgi:biotin operon repressor
VNKRLRVPESRLVTYLKNHFEKQGFLTATELNLGYGRADIVAFRINPARCRARFANGQLRSVDRLEHYILLRLLPELETGNAISLDQLSDKLEFSASHIRTKLLSFLIRFGYAIEVEPRRYAKINGFVPVTDEIIAVEAKVKDWRKGAIQAKRYQVFANRVFLALSNSYSHRVDSMILKKHNIGLFIVGDKVQQKIPAPKLRPRDCDRFNFATEWLWRHRRREIKEVLANAS